MIEQRRDCFPWRIFFRIAVEFDLQESLGDNLIRPLFHAIRFPGSSSRPFWCKSSSSTSKWDRHRMLSIRPRLQSLTLDEGNRRIVWYDIPVSTITPIYSILSRCYQQTSPIVHQLSSAHQIIVVSSVPMMIDIATQQSIHHRKHEREDEDDAHPHWRFNLNSTWNSNHKNLKCVERRCLRK